MSLLLHLLQQCCAVGGRDVFGRQPPRWPQGAPLRPQKLLLCLLLQGHTTCKGAAASLYGAPIAAAVAAVAGSTKAGAACAVVVGAAAIAVAAAVAIAVAAGTVAGAGSCSNDKWEANPVFRSEVMHSCGVGI